MQKRFQETLLPRAGEFLFQLRPVQIPLPFACCEIATGPVMRVAKEASDAEREELRKQLEVTMRSLTRD